MMAMIRREMLQHARWAWAVPFALLAAMAFESLAPSKHLSLTSDVFESAALFGLALVGGILGFVCFRELGTRGTRDVLWHRPVEAQRLFWGKVAGGVALYLLAAGPPLLVMVAWCGLAPRPYQPFSSVQVIPALVDLVGGMVFFLGGALVALRRARWHGGRLLPLAAAACFTTCTWASPHAALAFVIHALALGLMIPATRAPRWPPRGALRARRCPRRPYRKPARRSRRPP